MASSSKRDRVFCESFEQHGAQIVLATRLHADMFRALRDAPDLAKRITGHEHSGAGSARKVSAVRRGIAGRIVWGWLLANPRAVALSALSY